MPVPAKKLLFTALFVAAVAFLMITQRSASAQTASTAVGGLTINWSADTYVPLGFQGKRLPTSGSAITAWLNVFSGSKPISAAGYFVYWYADGQLLQSGKGITSVSFKAPRSTSQIVNLQARAQSPAGNLLVANIQVPIINPIVAIRSAYPGGIFTGPVANIAALSYFFNVSDLSSLSFQWSANGITAANGTDPSTAAINVGDGAPAGTKVRAQVTVTNPSDKTSASAYTNLIYQKL